MFPPPHRGIEGVWAYAVPVRRTEYPYETDVQIGERCFSISDGHMGPSLQKPCLPLDFCQVFKIEL